MHACSYAGPCRLPCKLKGVGREKWRSQDVQFRKCIAIAPGRRYRPGQAVVPEVEPVQARPAPGGCPAVGQGALQQVLLQVQLQHGLRAQACRHCSVCVGHTSYRLCCTAMCSTSWPCVARHGPLMLRLACACPRATLWQCAAERAHHPWARNPPCPNPHLNNNHSTDCRSTHLKASAPIVRQVALYPILLQVQLLEPPKGRPVGAPLRRQGARQVIGADVERLQRRERPRRGPRRRQRPCIGHAQHLGTRKKVRCL